MTHQIIVTKDGQNLACAVYSVGSEGRSQPVTLSEEAEKQIMVDIETLLGESAPTTIIFFESDVPVVVHFMLPSAVSSYDAAALTPALAKIYQFKALLESRVAAA